MPKLEFRDGEREVPDYLADMMVGIETYKLTVDEAIREANRQAENRHLQKAFDDVIAQHIRNAGIIR